jgi:hypothetical protein
MPRGMAMEEVLNCLWAEAEPVLRRLKGNLSDCQGVSDSIVGKWSNDAFPLTIYLTFLRRSDEDEVSLTMTLRRDGEGVLVETDIVGPDGEIISQGSNIMLEFEAGIESIRSQIVHWLSDVEAGFRLAEAKIRKTLSE